MYEEIIPVPQNPGQPFEVQITGISYCDGSYSIERKKSDIYCLEYIVSGTGIVCEEDTFFSASQGDVYLLHRGRSHFYYSDADDPWIKIWLNTRGPLVDNLMTLYGLDSVCHIPNAVGMEDLFRAFVDNARRRYNQQPDCVPDALLFHSILIGLSALLRAENRSVTLASQIKHTIDNTPNYNISLDEIAQQMFCSKSHAIKVFHEAYGIPPYEYILRQKTKLAMLLLQNSSLPISHIAEMLDFCDSHYFSGFFKSRTGMSPRQYRQNTY